MTELEQFADTLKRGFDGNSWQGRSLSELLTDIGPEQAMERPVAQAHSIWEIVLHIRVWHEVVRRRIVGEAVQPSDTESFPECAGGASEWQCAVEALRQSTYETATAICHFPEARLEDSVPGKNYAYRHLLSGIATHDAYHAGQIALLKKALV
jgi:uncharacterized damage-inducible protein DinB